MALPLGKLTIIVGAGLLGSVIAKEGHLPNVSDFFSGAFKIAWKQLKHDDSTTSKVKPRSDHALMQQVNNLREELQLLASNRSITIVSTNRSGTGKYGVVVIVLVAGYGYIWWKGWTLSDMMFATRRGLNDACSSVATQLEDVYSSISTTKKHLSSRIGLVDSKIDECAESTAATKDEVSAVQVDVKLIGADVQSVHHAVRSLETKISRIEDRQDTTNFGVGRLVSIVRERLAEQIEGAASSSSLPALQLPQVSPPRTVSLPTTSLLELPPPSSSNGFEEKETPLPASDSSQSNASASILKDLDKIAEGVGLNLSNPGVSNGSNETSSERSGGGLFGRRFSGFGVSLFSRNR